MTAPVALMTIAEAAQMLRVSPRMVNKLLRSRKLLRVKIGRATRIRVTDAERYIQRNTV